MHCCVYAPACCWLQPSTLLALLLQAAGAAEELFRFTSLLLLMYRMADLIEEAGADFWEQHGVAYCQLALALVGAPCFQAALADPGQRAEALARLAVASRLLRQVRGGMRLAVGGRTGWLGVTAARLVCCQAGLRVPS